MFGTDGISDAYASIRAGELDGTVDSFPVLTGEVAMEVALRLLGGQDLPRVVATPQALVTQDNVETYSGEGRRAARGAGSRSESGACVELTTSEPGGDLAWLTLKKAGGRPVADHPRLHLAGISKSFGVVRALEGVSLTVEPGEVHAPARRERRGQVDAAAASSPACFSPTRERSRSTASTIAPRGPVAARVAGIAMIHQELQQVPELTVAQNMFLGRPLTSAGGMLVSRGEQERRARQVLERLDPGIDPAAPIKTLKVAQRQIVEIARAVMEEAKIIAMDEPTSSLTPAEFERLVLLIEQLARERRLDHLRLAQDGRGVPALPARDDPARRPARRRARSDRGRRGGGRRPDGRPHARRRRAPARIGPMTSCSRRAT